MESQSSTAFIQAIPSLSATPLQIRAWLSTWFPEHLPPQKIDKEYLDFIQSVSWTGSDVYELGENEMTRELEGWGVRYSYAAGIARDICRARDIEVKKNRVGLPISIARQAGGLVLIILQDVLGGIFALILALFRNAMDLSKQE